MGSVWRFSHMYKILKLIFVKFIRTLGSFKNVYLSIISQNVENVRIKILKVKLLLHLHVTEKNL